MKREPCNRCGGTGKIRHPNNHSWINCPQCGGHGYCCDFRDVEMNDVDDWQDYEDEFDWPGSIRNIGEDEA